MNEKVFPTVLMILDFLAAVPYVAKGDVNLEYERRIKTMTLNKYLDSHTVREILKEDS